MSRWPQAWPQRLQLEAPGAPKAPEAPEALAPEVRLVGQAEVEGLVLRAVHWALPSLSKLLSCKCCLFWRKWRFFVWVSKNPWSKFGCCLRSIISGIGREQDEVFFGAKTQKHRKRIRCNSLCLGLS